MGMDSRKKNLMRLLAIVCAVAIVLAGCGGGGSAPSADTGGGSSSTGSDTGGEQPAAAKEPEDVGYPETLTIWAVLNGNAAATMQNANEIAAYQETEKITGTKVEWLHPPTPATEPFNVMISSGDLPDAIEYTWTSVPGGPDKMIEDGVILRLNELIDQYAPNLKRILDENPEWKKMITTDAGNIYLFPFFRGDEYLQTSNGIIIRQDWLDNLGLEMPTTIDEWHEVLTAFKTQDPNGNGVQDEIPLLIEWAGQIDYNHAFIGAWGITTRFYQVDGTVHFGPIQPEFKEFLTVMNQWYEEGLIDADYATTDGTMKDAKITGDQLGAFMGYTGSSIGRLMSLMEDHPTFNLAGAPYPTLNKGEKPLLGQKDHPYIGYGAAITTANQNPEATAKWYDFKYSEEGHMLFNFGIEGVSYEMIDGYPTYTDEVMNHPELPVTQAMSRYNLASYSGPFVQDRRYMEQYAALPQQKQAIETWMNAENDRLMPIVTPTAEESARYASIMNDVNTYISEMIDKFVMGVEPLDNFDQFVETLKAMGIEEAIAIQQAALDRYNAR